MDETLQSGDQKTNNLSCDPTADREFDKPVCSNKYGPIAPMRTGKNEVTLEGPQVLQDGLQVKVDNAVGSYDNSTSYPVSCICHRMFAFLVLSTQLRYLPD